MENSETICNFHNFAYIAACINQKCTNRLVCGKCIIAHFKVCGDNLVYFEDVQANNLLSLFQSEIISQAVMPSEAKVMTEGLNSTLALSNLSSLTSRFNDEIALKMAKLEEHLAESLKLSISVDQNTEKIKEIVGFELLEKMSITDYKDPQKIADLPLFGSQSEVVKKLKKLKHNLLPLINSKYTLDKVEATLEKLELLVEVELSQFMQTKVLKFNKKYLDKNQTLSKSDTCIHGIAEKPNLVDMTLEPFSGIYRWTVRVVNIPEDSVNSNTLFLSPFGNHNRLINPLLQLGICDSKEVKNSFASQANLRSFSFLKDDNCHKAIINCESSDSNKINFQEFTTLIYDSNNATLTFEQNNIEVLILNTKKETTFVPFVWSYRGVLEVELLN